ncbi:MAG: YbaN family protein [Oligoflexus sp.]
MDRKRQFVDYSHEVKVIGNRPLRYLLMTLSWLFVALGLLGAVLPVLPTTPFLILASICYAKSSPKFYNWLMNHPVFGSDLRRWTVAGVIQRKTKVIALSLLAVSLIPTIIFFIPLLPVKILLTVIGISVAVYIASRPEVVPEDFAERLASTDQKSP